MCSQLYILCFYSGSKRPSAVSQGKTVAFIRLILDLCLSFGLYFDTYFRVSSYIFLLSVIYIGCSLLEMIGQYRGKSRTNMFFIVSCLLDVPICILISYLSYEYVKSLPAFFIARCIVNVFGLIHMKV